MTGLEPADPAHDAPEAARPEPAGAGQLKPTGAWAGYLIFGLFLLVLIAFAVQAAYEDEWSQLAGTILLTLAVIAIPTGGVNWLRRRLGHRR